MPENDEGRLSIPSPQLTIYGLNSRNSYICEFICPEKGRQAPFLSYFQGCITERMMLTP